MIEGGFVLFVIGIILACATPAERAIAQRRWHRAEISVRSRLLVAFPIAPPSHSLEQLAYEAEAALDEDDVARGVRRIATVYDSIADN